MVVVLFEFNIAIELVQVFAECREFIVKIFFQLFASYLLRTAVNNEAAKYFTAFRALSVTTPCDIRFTFSFNILFIIVVVHLL